MRKLAILTCSLAALLLVPAVPASAKTAAPKLNKKTVSIKKGNKVTIKIKKANPKKTTWKISKAAKKYVSLTSKKKKSVVIKAKKAGTVTLKARVSYSGKVKTLKAKIKITNKKSGTSGANQSSDDTENSYSDITTNLKASLTEKGYVKLSWDKMEGASTYYAYRKAVGESEWKKVRTSVVPTATDWTVKENTRYMYRVQGDRDEDYERYSNIVSIRTGEVKNEEEDVTVPASETEEVETPEEKTEETANEPEEEEYQAKYTYEVQVLNQFNIYETNSKTSRAFVPIVLYIKTDNPNPNDYDGTLVSLSGTGYSYKYDDIEYVDDANFFKKVDGGWIYTIIFDTPGIRTVEIQELDKSVKAVYGDYDANGNSVWQTVQTYQIEVKDGKKSLEDYCSTVIETVSDDNYTSNSLWDTTNGKKWSELSDTEKMTRLEQYIISNYHYPRHGASTALGNLNIWVIQENVGAFWETGFADCGDANTLLCKLAEMIGIEAKIVSTTLNGGLHFVTYATIGGIDYKYDATPYSGGYQDWEPIELP